MESLQPDAGIGPGVGEVGEQIHHHEEQCAGDDQRLQQLQIGVVERVHSGESQPRNAEERFEQQAPGEEEGQGCTGPGDDLDRGVVDRYYGI